MSALIMTSAHQSWDEYWLPSDLFFLRDALGHGMTHAEVAGFLSRDEEEVRRKAKQMKRRHSPSSRLTTRSVSTSP
jgi:hypothetical protein